MAIVMAIHPELLGLERSVPWNAVQQRAPASFG